MLIHHGEQFAPRIRLGSHMGGLQSGLPHDVRALGPRAIVTMSASACRYRSRVHACRSIVARQYWKPTPVRNITTPNSPTASRQPKSATGAASVIGTSRTEGVTPRPGEPLDQPGGFVRASALERGHAQMLKTGGGLAHAPYLIGIGARLTTGPLPHHRAYGSVPRRFGWLNFGFRFQEQR